MKFAAAVRAATSFFAAFLFLVPLGAAGRGPEPLRPLPPRLGLDSLPPSTVVDAAFVFPETNHVFACGRFDVRFSPFSTFKIPATLIGLRAGVVKDRTTKLGWDGVERAIKEWNGDLTLEQAFRASCVPYFQTLMSRVKKDVAIRELKAMRYGDCDLSAWNESGHNTFWIESTLSISPLEQVRFLRAVREHDAASPQEAEILQNMMRLNEADGAIVFGKTGTGRNRETQRLEGWFVGWLRLPDDSVCVFAVHASDPTRDATGPWIRDELLPEFLKSGAWDRMRREQEGKGAAHSS